VFSVHRNLIFKSYVEKVNALTGSELDMTGALSATVRISVFW
jgi:hypothetical protein